VLVLFRYGLRASPEGKILKSLFVALAECLVTIYLRIILPLLIGLEVGSVRVVESLKSIFVVGRTIFARAAFIFVFVFVVISVGF